MTDDAPALTHGCIRCGAPIPLTDSMCERCNPLGLRQPAATQVHGTVIVAVLAAVVVLAVLARLPLAGVGPFSSTITDVAAADGGLAVTIAITNEGSPGAVMCRIADPERTGIGPETAFVQSPRVGEGETVTFTSTVTSLGTEPRELSVACGDA